MPQTESEKLKSGRPSGGRQPSLPVPGERRAGPGQPHPSDPASLQPSAWASGTQMTFPLTIGPGGPRMTSSHLQSILLQQCHGNEEEVRQLLQLRQHRPSVLRQGGRAQAAPLQPPPQAETASAQTIHLCKVEVEVDTGSHRQSSPPHSGPSPRHSHHSSPSRRTSPTQSNITARHHDGLALLTPGGSSALFLNGHCRWPGCDSVFEEFPNFLKHLHADHGHGDKSTAQWRVQQDMVQYMENQLTLEKQKLFAMQLHLHLSELKYPDLRAGSDWTHSLALVMPQAQAPDGVSRTVTKQSEELAQHEYWPTGPAHLLPDLVPSMECYKYNNIRPPYTYACLIRWAILEAPDKQRTLNEIYNWFTTMFFYFRHNTATWKNAVRHNLSLHKCFVRVEGGKGAVWTVDETEYQRRKGQKYHRDHPMRWLTPYSFFRPGEP